MSSAIGRAIGAFNTGFYTGNLHHPTRNVTVGTRLSATLKFSKLGHPVIRAWRLMLAMS